MGGGGGSDETGRDDQGKEEEEGLIWEGKEITLARTDEAHPSQQLSGLQLLEHLISKRELLV